MSRSIHVAMLVALVAVSLCVFVQPAVSQGCAGQMNIPVYPSERQDYWGVAAADGYAYTVSCSNRPSWTGKLKVFDVREPSHPVETGTLEINCAGNLVLSGRYAYVDQYDGNIAHVSVIDISDPSHPIEAGSIGGVRSIEAISNGYAYAVDSVGLRVFDLTDPATPREVGVLEAELGFISRNVAVAGNYAYVTSARDNQLTGYLHIVDVSDPEAAFFVGRVDVREPAPNHVAVSGDYAYVVTGGSFWQGELTAVDVSDPRAPVVVTQFYDGTSPKRPVVSGRFLYSMCKGDGYSYPLVFDLSDPSQPQKILWRNEVLVDFDGDQILWGWGSYNALCVGGRYVYTVGRLGLVIFDSRGCLYHEMPQERPDAFE